MKILVLGAGGRIGSAIVKDLMEIDSHEVTEIVAADISQERVARLAAAYESAKLKLEQVDVADQNKLVELFNGSDVVINSTVPAGSIPVDVLKAALKAHANVIDLGAWPEETEQSLALNDDFEQAGLTAILGLGSSPGITNLVAKALVDKLDSVETIELSFGYASLGTSSLPLAIPFEGALTEYIAEPLIFRNGKFEKLPPQSGLQNIEYPEPIGVRSSFYIGHAEILTFPYFFKDKGIENVCMRAGFTPDFSEKVNFLIDLGIINESPIKVEDTEVIPLDVLTACLDKLPSEGGEVIDYGCTRVVARGEKGQVSKEYTALMLNRPYQGLTNAQHRTSHSTAIGARMLCKGQIAKKGVFPPEAGVEPAPFFKELARRELEVEVTVKDFI
jgi:saccharopine dehydrogenase-like NADP-dependent oxidoreductase